MPRACVRPACEPLSLRQFPQRNCCMRGDREGHFPPSPSKSLFVSRRRFSLFLLSPIVFLKSSCSVDRSMAALSALHQMALMPRERATPMPRRASSPQPTYPIEAPLRLTLKLQPIHLTTRTTNTSRSSSVACPCYCPPWAPLPSQPATQHTTIQTHPTNDNKIEIASGWLLWGEMRAQDAEPPTIKGP